jgi:hypothetical protein
MMMDVFALLHGDELHFSHWREVARPAAGVYQFDQERWPDLALALTAMPPDDRGRTHELFLCLRDETLAGSHNRRVLEELLKTAVQRSWGAHLYLGIDDRLSARQWRNPNPQGLREWLAQALAGGVTDLLELRFAEHISGAALRRAADWSLERQARMREMLGAAGWKCYVPGQQPPLLGDFVIPFNQLKYHEKFLLVFDKDAREARIPLLRRLRRNYPLAWLVVVFCGGRDAQAEAVCRELDLKFVHCVGTFELLYFLAHLERANKRPGYRLSGLMPEDGEVQPAANQVFSRDRARGGPLVLLTNSFDDPRDCLEAAHDAGELRRVVPVSADYRVCPNLARVGLAHLLRETLPLAAWVYLGHGDKRQRLQNGGTFEPAKSWLQRFAGYQGALPLVFFGACRSAAVARRFAEMGAGVAIGFAGDVLPQACRLLARPVVAALLQAWDDPAVPLTEVILDAYEKGRRDLQASALAQAQPVAYFQKPT